MEFVQFETTQCGFALQFQSFFNSDLRSRTYVKIVKSDYFEVLCAVLIVELSPFSISHSRVGTYGLIGVPIW
ncbi:hypothetical protein F8388_026963 [Cannabis sativa]|uniref:Uncharacterized protein n=1 Tax=Cannabis sativa TaxID=3483 RepID=A0A7J6EDT6_CANSA|nr:hypothetical protein F8388_026963 [Cannabis sativa]